MRPLQRSISGTGSLTVSGNGNDGITSTDDLSLASGDDGIAAATDVVITGGTVDITAGPERQRMPGRRVSRPVSSPHSTAVRSPSTPPTTRCTRTARSGSAARPSPWMPATTACTPSRRSRCATAS
jgi:hypothetical protein